MKVFLAGHNGMVGQALTRYVPNNHKVIIKDRSELDLANSQDVFNFLSYANVDAVILAAARVGGIGANSAFQKDFLLQNMKIQNSVIEAADSLEIRNFVFLGSSCIYPRNSKIPILESELLKGELETTNEGYALAKITGLKLCQAISKEKGFNYFTMMPTNLYGSHDNFDPATGHVLAALMHRIHLAKLTNSSSIEVWGTGNPLREFLHVDDLARAIWELIDKPLSGEMINVGSGEEISIKDLALLLKEVIGYNGEIYFNPQKPDGTFRKLLDSTKITKLGWTPKINLKQGISDTYKWYLEHEDKGRLKGVN